MGDDRYSDAETSRRLKAALRGAFSGPPTQLADIPTRDGRNRQRTTTASSASSSAKAKTSRRGTGKKA
jgi:hypothetical protein